MDRTYQRNEYKITRTARRRQHLGMRILQLIGFALVIYAITR